MPVKSFECAIARSQIGRYLAGDPVDGEAMRQLEAHISGCEDCQRLIDSKREELLGPLAHAPSAEEALVTDEMERELRAAAATGHAVIQTPAPTPMPKPTFTGIGAALSRLPLPKLVREVPDDESPVAPVAPKAPARPLGKAAAYGGALLLVLGGMSFLGDPTNLLGGKAQAGTNLATKPTAKKPVATLAKASGVRRSALGIPITDAVDPSARAKAKSKARTLVAKAAPAKDPADLGPLEFDSTIDTPAPKTAAPKPAVPKPRTLVKRPARPVVRKRAVRKPVPTVTPAVTVTATPLVAKPAIKRAPVVRRPKRARKPLVKRTVKPAAPSPSVIRVYDESGQPIN